MADEEVFDFAAAIDQQGIGLIVQKLGGFFRVEVFHGVLRSLSSTELHCSDRAWLRLVAPCSAAYTLVVLLGFLLMRWLRFGGANPLSPAPLPQGERGENLRSFS